VRVETEAVTSWQGRRANVPLNFSLSEKNFLVAIFFQKYQISDFHFAKFRGKIKISSTHNPLCRKFAAVCRKIATSCPQLFNGRRRWREAKRQQTTATHATEQMAFVQQVYWVIYCQPQRRRITANEISATAPARDVVYVGDGH